MPRALCLVLLLAACSHDPTGWKRVATPHFALYSTEGRHAYAPTLEHLEMVHAALSESIFRGTQAEGFDVFLYNPVDAMPLLGSYAGRFIGNLGPHGTLLMRDSADGDFVEQLAAANLAFAFVGEAYPGAPPWFRQGMAGYVGTFRIVGPAACFGGRDRLITRESARGQLTPVSRLFLLDGAAFHTQWEFTNDATSWAVIHYIFHGEKGTLRGRFPEFATRFKSRTVGPGASLAAWSQIYPEIPLAQLDDRIRDHLNTVFERPAGKCMAFPFSRPAEPHYDVKPASPQLVGEREAFFRAHPLPLKN